MGIEEHYQEHEAGMFWMNSKLGEGDYALLQGALVFKTRMWLFKA